MQDNNSKFSSSHVEEENYSDSVNSNEQTHIYELKEEHDLTAKELEEKNIKTPYRKAVHHTRQIAEKLGLDPERKLETVVNKELREKVLSIASEMYKEDRQDINNYPPFHSEVIKKLDKNFAAKTGEDSVEYQKEYLNLHEMPKQDLEYLLSNALDTLQTHEEYIAEESQDKLEEKDDLDEQKLDKQEELDLKKEMCAVKFEVKETIANNKDAVAKEDPNAPMHEVKTLTSDNKEVKINFYKGLKHGPMTITGEHGHMEMEVGFSKDKLDGQSKYYFPNGKLERIVEFKAGKMHGLMQVFHEDGKPSMEMYFNNGLMHGLSKMYNEKGDLHISSNYTDGKLDGEMVVYANGKPYLKRIYKHGNEIGQEMNASLLKHVH